MRLKGEKGIRTLDTGVCRFSKPMRSTTLPFLHLVYFAILIYSYIYVFIIVYLIILSLLKTNAKVGIEPTYTRL